MNDKVKVIVAVVLLVAAVGIIVWYLGRGGSAPTGAQLEGLQGAPAQE
ncbi:MAG: hypothetical protein KF684_09270 [Phycisphaeraceae bacterium]|nr:hypothetical protein [Phycisphaeraceae bacterium]